MPPAIIAAAVGLAASAAAAAGYIALTTAIAISIAASVAGALLTKASVPSIGDYTSQQERKQVLRSAVAPRVYIYGTTVVSGLLFFAEEQPGKQDEDEWVHLALAICSHEVDSVTKVWLGDEEIGNYSGFATYTIHNNRQTADPFMLANCASWKDDMIGKGVCWARISLKFNADKFPSGLPNIKFQVRGKKIYDPRDGTTKWSDNAALCIRDYYSSYLNVDPSDIDDTQFIQAANISDQGVNDGGGLRPRYTINGNFDASETQAGVLDDLHLACAGEPTYMAGKHGLLVGAYYGPATMTINEGQIISDVKIIPEAMISEKLNTVTGTFVDADQQYTEVDYPSVQIQEYYDEDGYEFSDDAKYRFVSNVYQAQQLATIKINRTRIGRTIQFTMNLSGYQYRPGYYTILNIPQMGIVGQEFRITDWSFSSNDGVDITLKQETSAVWGDAIGQAIERPEITDFPKGTVAQPINVTYTVQNIGEVVQGVLSWTNIGSFTYNIVLIRKNGVVVQTIQVPGSMVNLTGMVRGSYTAAVIAVNALGMRSAEAYAEIEIQAPDIPSGCDVIQGFFEVTLKPRVDTIANVSTQFDFWTSGLTRLANASTSVVTANATREGIGTIWSSDHLQNDKSYWWYIRSINAFGTSNFLEVEAHYVLDTVDAITLIEGSLKDTDTYKDLNSAVEDIDDKVIDVQNELGDTNLAVGQLQTGLNAEQQARIQGDIATANKAASDLLAEATTRGAAITDVQNTIQNVNDSLSQQISQVSAGTGTQFDSSTIWYFDSTIEGWSASSGTPTIVDGWLRPPSVLTANPYLQSPDNLNIGASTYRFLKLRIKVVGTYTWRGKLFWNGPSDTAFADARSMTLPEPTFDANGVATIEFDDIPWNGVTTLRRIALSMTAAVTASTYYLLDWVAIGRPTPGASVAALQNEITARQNADSAEVTARQTLATQIRGGYDGTDVSLVTSGLIYSERTSRVAADEAINSQITILQGSVNGNTALINDTLVSAITAGLAENIAYRDQRAQFGAAQARITRTETTSADNTQAIAQTKVEMLAQYNEVTTKITDESVARSTADEALAQRSSTLESNLATQTARITDEATTRANETSALATRTSSLETRTGNNESSITNLTQTVTNNQQSLSQQINQVKATADDAAAGVSTNATAITNVDTKADQIAQRVTAVEATSGSNSSKITVLEQTVTNNQQSTSSQISQVKATADGAAAGVTTNSTAIANINGKLSAQWQVKVDANGAVAGIALGIDQTGVSNFMIKADTFTVWNGSTGQASFMLYNGQAYLRSTFILDGTIDNAKIGYQISSTNWNDRTPTDGGTGWCIRKDGQAYFSQGQFRGNIYADTGYFVGDVYANNGWFRGTVYAEKIEGDITKCIIALPGQTIYIAAMPFARTLSIPNFSMGCDYWTGQTGTTYGAGYEIRIGSTYDQVSISINNKGTLSRAIAKVYTIPANVDAHVNFNNNDSHSIGVVVAYAFRS